MARCESVSTTMPLNAKILIALIFLAFAITATTSTRILDEIETPEEPNSAAESPVVSPLPLVAESPVAEVKGVDQQHHTLSFFMHDILGVRETQRSKPSSEQRRSTEQQQPSFPHRTGGYHGQRLQQQQLAQRWGRFPGH